MKSMILRQITDITYNKSPLTPADRPVPEPGPGQLLLKISACAVCHTELDEIEGRTPPPRLPVIPGHQIVGLVKATGAGTHQRQVGERVGVAWIFSACGECLYCLSGQENLCPNFLATGRDADGGYSEYMVVPEKFTYPIPEDYSDAEAAPLLCAGAIGYRSVRLANLTDGRRLGLTGFGASGHLVLKLARFQFPAGEVYVFARNPQEREFARELGAVWTGDTADMAPVKLDAIIDTTPVWKPVVEALRNLAPGGRLVINAIRKEEFDKPYLLNIDYPSHLWLEKEIKSVANVTRRDVAEFLSLAAEMGISPEYQEYPLADANQALVDLKEQRIRGAKVLRVA